MAWKNKNLYVHPAPEKGMTNQVGRDGYSFDEYDHPEAEDELEEKPSRRLPDTSSIKDCAGGPDLER